MVQAYTIKMNVTHDGTTMRLQESRFDSRQTVRVVKEILSYKFGSNEDQMNLSLLDGRENPICMMDDDKKTLHEYECKENYTIHVAYEGPNMLGEFEDVSKVEKYVISEDAYKKRTDTFRKFKEEMQDSTHANFKKPETAEN